jgi:hypothetical protein
MTDEKFKATLADLIKLDRLLTEPSQCSSSQVLAYRTAVS